MVFEEEWSGDWWVPPDGRLVPRKLARAIVANRSILVVGDSTARRLTATMALQLVGDTSPQGAENEYFLTMGGHGHLDWTNHLPTLRRYVPSLRFEYLDLFHKIHRRYCTEKGTFMQTPDVLVVATGLHHLGIDSRFGRNSRNLTTYIPTLVEIANELVAGLGCVCQKLKPGGILVWRTIPPIGGTHGIGNMSNADLRADRNAVLQNIALTNDQALLLNRMVLDLIFCREPALRTANRSISGPGAVPRSELKQHHACLSSRLRVADFGRSMLRHNAGDPANKLSALPPASLLPHYNNLARSIELQLTYRAILNWTAAGPAMLPCVTWPGIPLYSVAWHPLM